MLGYFCLSVLPLPPAGPDKVGFGMLQALDGIAFFLNCVALKYSITSSPVIGLSSSSAVAASSAPAAKGPH